LCALSTIFLHSVIFSLNRPLEETFEPTFFADFYEAVAGKVVYLPITDKTGTDFRISYLEKITNKKLDKELLKQVFELTGAHTNLVRLCVESMLASDEKLENKQLMRKYFLTQKPIRSALFAIWNFLTPGEKRQIVKGELKDSPFLENVGLIKDGLVTVPLFSDYAKEKAPELERESLDINALFEKLTSLEYRMLKFLLENKGRVVEKEEIINAVWGDQKTVLGVTDQALDQLVFRLRKKIEENPNSPTHIQTIKGRGFKFTP